MFNVRKKQDAVCNPKPATRNPQRVAFTMEPLTGVIKAEPFGLGYLLLISGNTLFCLFMIIICR